MTDRTPYCIVDGCPKQAIGKRPVGVTSDGIPIVELVCEEHETCDGPPCPHPMNYRQHPHREWSVCDRCGEITGDIPRYYPKPTNEHWLGILRVGVGVLLWAAGSVISFAPLAMPGTQWWGFLGWLPIGLGSWMVLTSIFNDMSPSR